MSELLLFGPQRLHPILRPELERLGVEGQVAAITAGWQEREGEVEDLAAHVEREVVDLKLHRRTEEVFEEDPNLFRAHRARQDRLQVAQRWYRLRLEAVIQPARQLLRIDGEPGLLADVRESAIETVRRLDAEHLDRIQSIHAEFLADWDPMARTSVARHRREMAEILDECGAVMIAGGHVAALLNRLRLFGVHELFDAQPILAWSAGAMALGERIVLFHDSPPQGPSAAEVLDVGLGLYGGLLPLPHASSRLRLADRARVELFVRRFASDLCVPLDAGDVVRRADGVWQPGRRSSSVLSAEGTVKRWAA